SNTGKDFGWIASHARGDVEVVDASARWAQLALQGPKSETILTPMAPAPLSPLRPFHFIETRLDGVQSIVARTGYTGEDGFEIYLAPEAAPALFTALLRQGRPQGLLPCGLGARDTLRLEACLPLYGNDIDETTTALEPGLRRIGKLEKGPFSGAEALRREAEVGPTRRRVGCEVMDRGERRRRDSRHHALRPVGARRHRLCRAAVRRLAGRGGRGVRHSRVGEGGLGDLRSRLG